MKLCCRDTETGVGWCGGGMAWIGLIALGELIFKSWTRLSIGWDTVTGAGVSSIFSSIFFSISSSTNIFMAGIVGNTI